MGFGFGISFVLVGLMGILVWDLLVGCMGLLFVIGWYCRLFLVLA